MSRKVVTKSSVIGLKVYTSEAELVGTVSDLAFDIQNPTSMHLVIEGTSKRYLIPISYMKALGDIIILKEDTPLDEFAEEKPAAPAAVTPTQTVTTAQPTPQAGPTAAPTARPSTTPVGQQWVVPRCSKCGAALIYYPQYRRWYCPRCRQYVNVVPDVLARVPKCPTCGNYLSYIEQYKRWYCYHCQKYVNM